MGFFDLFRSQAEGPEQKDLRVATCPYCKESLKKVPGAKTKCPHCDRYMFVRTRPKDNARVVVTEAEAEQIEEEWSIVAGTHEEYIANKQRIEHEREALKRKFGREPSNGDVQWSLLNKDLITHASHCDWGFYRNTRLTMAELLRRELKLRDSLLTYLEVCYIDLNGPNNLGGMGGKEMPGFPAFDPQTGMLAPGIIYELKRMQNKLGTSVVDLQKMYTSHNQIVRQSLKLPLTTEITWRCLDKTLSERL